LDNKVIDLQKYLQLKMPYHLIFFIRFVTTVPADSESVFELY